MSDEKYSTPETNDLIPSDEEDETPRLNADSIDAALAAAAAEAPVDLGNGLQLAPYRGRKIGLLVIKDGSSVGDLSTLSRDDLGKIHESLLKPEIFNDLIPSDKGPEIDPPELSPDYDEGGR